MKKKNKVVSILSGTDQNPLSRYRNYGGQHQTFQGSRGGLQVKGLTTRDISDCIVRSFLKCSRDQLVEMSSEEEHDRKMSRDEYEYNTLYKLDLNKLDPIAVLQNTVCEIEKMMDVYPYLPEFIIREGKTVKGGVNRNPPTSKRPKPPVGTKGKKI